MNQVTDYGITSVLGGTHIPSDGSGVANSATSPDPVMPYGVFNSPSSPACKVMVHTGNAYSVFEMFFTRQVCENTGSLVVNFSFWIDVNAAQYAQVFETDTIWVVNGFKYNGSVQINNEEGGQLQIVNQAGNWVDVPGAKPGILSPYFHEFTITYKFDIVAKTLQVVSIEIDNIVYTVPATMKVNAIATTWANGACVSQCQVARNALGAIETFVVEVDDWSNT